MGSVNPIVIVAGCESYRTEDFVAAAEVLRCEVTVASDADSPASGPGGFVHIDLQDPASAAAAIAAAVPDAVAVVAVDDGGVMTAVEAAIRLGLPHNPPAAIAATRDKLAMRRLLADADVPQPRFGAARPGEVPTIGETVGYPIVVKPVGMSASRGVVRADGPAEAARAEARVRAILAAAGQEADAALLVEEYVPGIEVAIEGLIVDGRMRVLAVIDKPGIPSGPFFEETFFVTPSRLPPGTQDAAVALVGDAATALGLTRGPVHGEVRIPPGGGPRLIEIAARTIGGLCGRAFTFGLLGERLEQVILRGALGLPEMDTSAARPASGVLMLPIPATGTLTAIEGIDRAREVEGITAIEITVPSGRRIEALPEGDRYLGFVFAQGHTPEEVETSLREAGALLTVAIDGEDVRPLV